VPACIVDVVRVVLDAVVLLDGRGRFRRGRNITGGGKRSVC